MFPVLWGQGRILEKETRGEIGKAVMRRKVTRTLITIELIILILAIIGLAWLFIIFRVPQEIGEVIEDESKEMVGIEEVLTEPQKGEKEIIRVFPEGDKIIDKIKIPPPKGFPQTPEEEKKFMEKLKNPPEPKKGEEVKIKGESAIAF